MFEEKHDVPKRSILIFLFSIQYTYVEYIE